MKNSVLDFKKEELDEFIVSDYFSKDISVWEMFRELKDSLNVYKVDNGDKIERISYELYGTTDYWDLILLINDRIPLFEMPYEYDLIENVSGKEISLYKNYVYDNAPLTQKRTDALFDERLTELTEINESYRFIYVIKPSQITNIFALLRSKGYL